MIYGYAKGGSEIIWAPAMVTAVQQFCFAQSGSLRCPHGDNEDETTSAVSKHDQQGVQGMNGARALFTTHSAWICMLGFPQHSLLLLAS
jgi:hypothetical protein